MMKKHIHTALVYSVIVGLLFSVGLGCSKGTTTETSPAPPQSAMPDDPAQRAIAERIKQQSDAAAQHAKENATRAGVNTN